MRLICLFALTALAAVPAYAADAPTGAAPAAEPPICTTTTTVVKRGDVVLSSNTTTRCEDADHPGGGIHPGAVLAAPEKMIAAPALAVDGLFQGGGDSLSPRNTAGDWRVVNSRTGDVCHLTLSVRTNATGHVVRAEGCRDELAHVGAWTYRDGGAELLQADGQVIVRLTGTRDQIKGTAADGAAITLQR